MANGKSKKIQTWVAIVVAVFTIIGGVYAVTTTFATNKRVDKVEIVTEKNLKEKVTTLEIEVAGAIQNTQMKSDYRYYQILLDKYNQDLMEIKRQLRRSPDDQGLRQDYQDIKQERDRIKVKMENLMEKMN
jgi:flagellar basal body-associated protein FliL